MGQPNSIPAPTPPPTPQDRGLGDAIKKSINDAVAAGLAGTRAELQREVSRLELRRAALQEAAADAPSGAARLAIERKLAEVDQELAKTRSAVDKLDRQLPTRDASPT